MSFVKVKDWIKTIALSNEKGTSSLFMGGNNDGMTWTVLVPTLQKENVWNIALNYCRLTKKVA